MIDGADSQNGKNSQNGKTTGDQGVATAQLQNLYTFLHSNGIRGNFVNRLMLGLPAPAFNVYLCNTPGISEYFIQSSGNNLIYPRGELLRLFHEAGIRFQ